MRTKSWPFWETWKSIFGKDRASGGGAEELADASVRQRSKVAAASQTHDNNEYHPISEEGFGEGTDPGAEQVELNDSSSGNDTMNTTTTKNGSRKRKSTSSDDALMEFLGNLHAETNSRLEVISLRIGYEFDLGKARQEVYDKLGTVDGLTVDERYDLCDILSDKSQRLEVFMGMPPSARLGHVKRFLK